MTDLRHLITPRLICFDQDHLSLLTINPPGTNIRPQSTISAMLFRLLCVLATAVSETTALSLRDTIAARSDLTIFKDLVDQFDVWNPLESMANITVLAPNNAAYELLGSIGLNLSEMGADFTVPVLKYHFLEGIYNSTAFSHSAHATIVHTALTGLNQTASAPVKLSDHDGSQTVEGGLQLSAGVVQADIGFEGGVLHTLNSTLVAPHNISATAFMNGLYAFLQAMDDSGMVGELESLRDATLFIPTDAAWRKYKKSLRDNGDQADLARVLRYHSIEGRVLYHSDVTTHKQGFKTVEGQAVELDTDSRGHVKVNGVATIKEDLVWYGGVAYLIDEVLVPSKYSSIDGQTPMQRLHLTPGSEASHSDSEVRGGLPSLAACASAMAEAFSERPLMSGFVGAASLGLMAAMLIALSQAWRRLATSRAQTLQWREEGFLSGELKPYWLG